jgi:hypothetical protein
MRTGDSIMVFAFRFWSASLNQHLVSRCKAPLDVIERRKGTPLEETAEEVPLHALDDNRCYELPEQEWQSSSHDLLRGLDVIEVPDVDDDPDVKP